MYEICQQYRETKQLCVFKDFCVLVMQFKEEIFISLLGRARSSCSVTGRRTGRTLTLWWAMLLNGRNLLDKSVS